MVAGSQCDLLEHIRLGTRHSYVHRTIYVTNARISWALFLESNVGAPSLIQPSSHRPYPSALHVHTGPSQVIAIVN